jgi:acyl-coenzyme A thioesterase PaaI-like protein
MVEAVPFNQELGVEVLNASEQGSVVRLPERPGLRNHLGTIHSTALFGAGDAASGAAMAALLGTSAGTMAPVVTSSSIRYIRPARGSIIARARAVGSPRAILERLEEEGATVFTIEVHVEDLSGTRVAEMRVEWFVRPARAA